MSDTGQQPPIGDYALISDMHSCALVSREGSVDWACFPRFDMQINREGHRGAQVQPWLR